MVFSHKASRLALVIACACIMGARAETAWDGTYDITNTSELYYVDSGTVTINAARTIAAGCTLEIRTGGTLSTSTNDLFINGTISVKGGTLNQVAGAKVYVGYNATGGVLSISSGAINTTWDFFIGYAQTGQTAGGTLNIPSGKTLYFGDNSSATNNLTLNFTQDVEWAITGAGAISNQNV